MASGLPTTDTINKAVNTFGIGTYDSQPDSDGAHGEDSEKKEPEGESLPQDGGPLDPFGPDRLLSYPQESNSQGKHASPLHASTELPGDYDIPPTGRKPTQDILDSVVHSVSQSELPSDSDNPPARSDYYDKLQTGGIGRTQDFWPSEDSGAYVSQEKKLSDSELPTVNKNEEMLDNYLGALGNYWSGKEIEDVSGPQGFPTEDFKENIDYDRSDNQDGGKIMANSIFAFLKHGFRNMKNHIAADEHGRREDERPDAPDYNEPCPECGGENTEQIDESMLAPLAPLTKLVHSEKDHGLKCNDCHKTFWFDPFKGEYSGVKKQSARIATDIPLVQELTKEFIKEFGKVDLTRRHVMAFLTEKGRPQYLASDIIRCLKHNHKLVIPDVLDTFPIKDFKNKKASMSGIHERLVELQIENVIDPGTSIEFGKCAADVAVAMAFLNKVQETQK